MMQNAVLITVASAAVSLLCFLTRIYPLLGRKHAGCDAYYFLLCREIFIKNKRLPIVLPPYYALEYQEQWYPPGFTVFLSLIPKRFLDKYYWCISPAVDSLLCGGVFLFTAAFTSSLPAGAVAAAVYITSQAATGETAALTSRQLGALLAAGCVFSGILYATGGGAYMLAAAVVFGAMVLLTHKFSAQALYIALPAMALVNLEPKFLFVLAASIGCALAASLGFYVKIFLSHVDYIAFWSKRWPFLGAHQVNDSPVCSDAAAGENFIYKKGWRHSMRFVRALASDNLYFAAAAALLLAHFVQPDFSKKGALYSAEELYAARFALIVLGIGLFVHLVPALRGIGQGAQYGKLALPAGAFCCGCALAHPAAGYVSILFAALSVVRYIKNLPASLKKEVSAAGAGWNVNEMGELFDYFKSLEDPLLLCLPPHYFDIVVYHCRIRVLWGGHGSPVRRLDSLWPVLKEPVGEICEKNGVTHILVDSNFTAPEKVGIKGAPCWEFGKIKIFKCGRELFNEIKK